MLLCFTFRAKRGNEEAFEALLNDPGAAEHVALAMGATRNTLFLSGGQMVRVLEFPEGARPVPLADIAAKDPVVHQFLEKLGPLVEEGFDIAHPESLEAFNKRAAVAFAYDVRTELP